MRHLRGKVRLAAANIKDMEQLLDVSKKQFDAGIDQKLVGDSLHVDSYFKIIMLFSVLTGVGDVVSSLYGMNVKLPGREEDSYLPFSLLLSIMLVIGVALYFLLRWCCPVSI